MTVSIRNIHGVVHSYESASKFLSTKRVKKLANNTWVIMRENFIEVTLHGKTIAVYYPHDEYMMISSCGWETYTTKQRLNQLTSTRYSIYQVRHKWYVHDFQTGKELVFRDQMMLDV